MAQEGEKFQRGELMKRVLLGIGTGLAIGAVLTMPGILLALKPFLENKKVSSQAIGKTYKTLLRRKFVKIREKDGGQVLEITEAGRKRKKEYQAEDIKISVPREWDGKWRIIIFDIPEVKKRAREALRNTLDRLGCYRLQDSVFVHPFACENEIDFVSEIFGVQKHVYCFTAAMQKVPPSVAYRFAKLLTPYSS